MLGVEPTVQQEVAREVLKELVTFEMHQPPPVMGQKIHKIIRNVLGASDPYAEIKDRFNRFALSLEGRLRDRLDHADDKLGLAIRLAAAGNMIDFGVSTQIDTDDVVKAIDHALDVELDAGQVELFRRELPAAKNILYLADNAGEIVFDKLLIELLPTERTTVAVKGSAIINDATYHDAEQVGLTGLVNVIDNGSDAPGTVLDQCSDGFITAFNSADLIIAKGQGHYETLSGEIDRPVWFLLKAKCHVIAKHLAMPIGSIVFRRIDALDAT